MLFTELWQTALFKIPSSSPDVPTTGHESRLKRSSGYDLPTPKRLRTENQERREIRIQNVGQQGESVEEGPASAAAMLAGMGISGNIVPQ